MPNHVRNELYFNCNNKEGFPTGTNREEIWHWFEEQFNISVAKDLMGV